MCEGILRYFGQVLFLFHCSCIFFVNSADPHYHYSHSILLQTCRSLAQEAAASWDNTQRRTVSPFMFLELLRNHHALYCQQHLLHTSCHERYSQGCATISYTEQQMTQLQQELLDLSPKIDAAQSSVKRQYEHVEQVAIARTQRRLNR